MRCLYSAVKVRRLAPATTSGSGRGGLGGSGATALPATALRETSLRSASLRSVAGNAVGEAGEIPLSFTLIPILALLSNYDQENCLINVGTEGRTLPWQLVLPMVEILALAREGAGELIREAGLQLILLAMAGDGGADGRQVSAIAG